MESNNNYHKMQNQCTTFDLRAKCTTFDPEPNQEEVVMHLLVPPTELNEQVRSRYLENLEQFGSVHMQFHHNSTQAVKKGFQSSIRSYSEGDHARIMLLPPPPLPHRLQQRRTAVSLIAVRTTAKNNEAFHIRTY